MTHQPVSVVSKCGAAAWLNGLASGDQSQLTGSGSASEVFATMRYTNPPLINFTYYVPLVNCIPVYIRQPIKEQVECEGIMSRLTN